MIQRPLTEFRLDAAPHGVRAHELLAAAVSELRESSSNLPGLCAAALLTADGEIHLGMTEVILGEMHTHAVRRAILAMLRTTSRQVLMAAVLRRALGGYQLILPCGLCRMALYGVTGSVDIHIVQSSAFHSSLTIIELNELLPYPEGGNPRDIPAKFLPSKAK